ncbi:MAG: hypothetical protein ABI602_03455 [Candidatus Saccharibacteria bacterium]
MPQAPATIIYHNPDTKRDYSVHRLQRPTVNLHVARKILELTAASYAHQFEDPAMQQGLATIQPGTMRTRFLGPELANIRQMYHMNRALVRGSRYWQIGQIDGHPTAADLANPELSDIAGLLKATPARPNLGQQLHLRPPDCQVSAFVVEAPLPNDVLIDKPHRLGSMLLHAALAYDDYDPSAKVAVDSFVGSDANAWFGRLGLMADTAEPGSWVASAAVSLPTVRYVSQPGLVLRDHVAALEQAAPWLARARPLSES